jgi:sigma-B regulation protein RsbU (phosphoserine phosphatase)
MKRILVVDDNEASRLLLVHHLGRARPAYEIIQSVDGLSAVARTAAESFDLVLMDMAMPGLDGLATVRCIRENPRLALLPIIFLSAEEDRARWVEAFESGASDFVHKPCEMRELLARIDTHLRISTLTRLLDRKNVQLERERRLARTVQAGLLPRDLDLPGLETATFYRAQEQIGGDFYDAWQRGGQIHCVIGDISGHGTPSALLMAVCKGLLQSLALEFSRPRQAVAELNHMLYAMCDQGDLAMFVTLVYASLDLAQNELRLVSAGHVPVYRLTDAGPEAIGPTGPALGLTAEFEYGERLLPFHPGEGLLLYTDGLVDAQALSGERFGAERLEHLCAGEKRPKQLLRALADAAESFCDGNYSDDVAMFALRRRDG